MDRSKVLCVSLCAPVFEDLFFRIPPSLRVVVTLTLDS